MTSRKRSEVWEYFSKDDSAFARCNGVMLVLLKLREKKRITEPRGQLLHSGTT